jgi:hypothetical protein
MDTNASKHKIKSRFTQRKVCFSAASTALSGTRSAVADTEHVSPGKNDKP